MDLMRWIRDEHASVRTRFERSVGSIVPIERWRDPLGPGGSSLAWLMFHAAYHEDLAINGVLRGGRPLIDGRRAALGIAGAEPHVGLGETEAADVTATLDLDALGEYFDDVPVATETWMLELTADQLDERPDAAGALDRAGVSDAAAPWLYRLWSGQPTAFFVQWEAIGHRINHVGEMVALRNRMGLSPF